MAHGGAVVCSSTPETEVALRCHNARSKPAVIVNSLMAGPAEDDTIVDLIRTTERVRVDMMSEFFLPIEVLSTHTAPTSLTPAGITLRGFGESHDFVPFDSGSDAKDDNRSNGCNQRLATLGLPYFTDSIASPLHFVVRNAIPILRPEPRLEGTEVLRKQLLPTPLHNFRRSAS